jgi:recombinational DNA repair ATPase RecF
MKIKQIKIEKFKKLENFEFNPDGKNYFITGENSIGKSSLMQFLEIATGIDTNIPENLVGKGVVIGTKEDGEYEFKVKIKDGKAVIQVQSPDGLKDDRKANLKAVTHAIGFDIMEFVKLSESKAGQKKQVEIYKSFLDSEIIEQIERLKKDVEISYNDRTEANKELIRLKSVVDSHRYARLDNGELEKLKPVDTSALMSEQEKISAHNKTIGEFVVRLEGKKEELVTSQKAAADIEKQIEELQKKLKEKQAEIELEKGKIKTGEEYLAANPLKDVTAISEQIKNASQTNQDASDAAELIKQRGLYAKVQTEWEALEITVNTKRQSITDAIRDMDSPVPGLSFNEDSLLYNDLPVEFGSLSESEIMLLGMKMFIARNKEYGIVYLENSNLIGQKRWSELLELVKENDLQLFAEEVVRGQDDLIMVEIEGK